MVIIFYLQLFVSLGFLIIFQFFPVYKRKICAFFFLAKSQRYFRFSSAGNNSSILLHMQVITFCSHLT